MKTLLFIVFFISGISNGKIQQNIGLENLSYLDANECYQPLNYTPSNFYSTSLYNDGGYNYSVDKLYEGSSGNIISFGGIIYSQESTNSLKNNGMNINKTNDNITFSYGLLGGKESKYEDYCDACYRAGVRPLPIDAWSNGQWNGSSNTFHPKSPTPTGFENEYWEEHDDPTVPMDEGIDVSMFLSLIYAILLRRKIKE